MRKLLCLLALAPLVVVAQPFKSSPPFSFVDTAANILAKNCRVGQAPSFAIDATAGANIYLCTSTNIWTQAGGVGGPPSGAAGGVLRGTYPNPGTNLVFDAQDYGWACDGTDQSTNALALLSTVNTAGGGAIYFRPCTSTYRADSQLLMPNDGASPQPNQKNISFIGAAGGGAWYGTTAVVLDLRYHGPGGKIETRGKGTIIISNLTIKDGGTAGAGQSYSVTGATLTNIVVTSNSAVATFAASAPSSAYVGASWRVSGSTTSALNDLYLITAIGASTMTFTTVGVSDGTYNNGPLTVSYSSPFFHSTNTTPIITGNTFIGNGVYPVGTVTAQDAIVLGGTSGTAGAVVNSEFQGYKARIVDNHFTRLNRALYILADANDVTFQRNSFQGNTGTRAIECNGSYHGGNGGYGNDISFNTIEMDVYTYGVVLKSCQNNVFVANGFYDAGGAAASYFFLTSSTQNTIIPSFTQTAGANTVPLISDTDGSLATSSVYTTIVSAHRQNDSANSTYGSESLQVAYNAVIRGQWDSTLLTTGYPGQLTLVDFTGAATRLSMGVKSSDNTFAIDAYKIGVAAEPLQLNPSGGIIILPIKAGATTTTSGGIIHDSTNSNLHYGANSVDNIVPLVVASSPLVNTNYVKASVVSGLVRLVDGGSSAGNPVNYQTSANFTGIGPTAFTPTHTLDIFDNTTTTGSTNLTVKRGAGQSGNVVDIKWGSSNGTVSVNDPGTLYGNDASNHVGWQLVSSGAVTSLRGSSTFYIAFNTTNDLNGGALDTGVCRGAAGQLNVHDGSGTCTNYRDVEARSYIAGGAVPGISGCSAGTQVGGNTSGLYSSGTTGTCTVTLTFAKTAPTGWSCMANDRTTSADLQAQTASTTTTATIAGTTISGDVINFYCIAY